MADAIDRLEIQVQAQAQKANSELDKLISKLERMSGSLSRITEGGGINKLASGIDRLSTSMQNISNVRTTDFTRLAKNIEKLGNINQAGINNTASALRQISSALTAASGMSGSAQQLAELANGISRLGYKSVGNAIANLPKLAQSLRQFMQVLSDAPKVSQNLIQMTQAMANLAAQGSKYSSTINSISRATNTLTKAHNESYKSSINLIARLSKLSVAYYVLRRAVRAAMEPIQSAMDFGETINLFQTSFKKIGMQAAEYAGMEWGSEAANAFAKQFIDYAQSFNDQITEALSLDPNVIMKYQAVFSQMANAFGLTSRSVMNLSSSFTMLGLDIASFFNTDVEEAMVKLRAGLAGETEPLRALGVDITEATLKMTAMKYGIEDSIESMSQAAKTQLRWLAIMDQTETVFGDMAKTIDSPANQVRVLQQQFENLTRSIGSVFLPVIQTILPYVNAVVIVIRRLVDTIAQAIGYELPDYTDSELYTDISGDIGAIGDSADDANDSATKLKKTLASFDELNILGDSKVKGINLNLNGGYDSLDDAISQKTNSYMTKFNEELEKAGNSAKDIAENIQSFFKTVGEKVEPTTKALKELWDDGLSKLGNFVATNLINFYDNFLAPVGSWVLGEGLPGLANILNDFLSNTELDGLSTSFEDLWEALAPFAISIGQGLVDFIGACAEILTPVFNTTVSNLSMALEGLATLINSIPEEAAIAIGGAIGGIATAILMFNAGKSVKGIIDGIKDAFVGEKGLIPLIKAHPVLAIAAGIGALAGAVLALDKAKFDASPLGEYIKKVDELTKSSSALNDEIQELLDKNEERRSDIESEYGAVQILADKYFALADVENRTNSENELLKSYAKELIDKIPELSGLIDEQTGAYKGTKEEIQGLIEKTKEYYLVQAAQESLIEIAKKQYEAEKNLKSLQDERTTAQQKLDDITAEYNETLTTSTSRSSSLTQEQKDAALKAIELSSKMTELKKTIDKLDGQIDTTKELQSKLNSEWDYAEDYIKTYSSTTSTEMPKVKSAVTTAFDEIKTKVSNFTLPDLKTRVLVDTSALENLGNYYKSAKIPGPYIEQKATGGYVNTGEMFLARENGIPEMVGRIGNRTAVANNDQITEGIATAVENAMMNVLVPVLTRLNGNNNSGDIAINIDGKEVFRAVRNQSKQYYDMTGKAPFPA